MRSIPKLLTILLPILVIPINLFAGNLIQLQDVIVSASSTLKDSPQYSPSNLLDPKPPEESDLNWCEGKSDAGIGEWVYFQFMKPIPIFSVTVYNGFWKQPKSGGDSEWGEDGKLKIWSSNNRVKVMEVIIDDGIQFQAKLVDDSGVCYDGNCSLDSDWVCGLPRNNNCIPFPEPQKPISGFKLMIKDIYRGEKWNDTCLHHVEILKWTPKIQLDDAIRSFLFPSDGQYDQHAPSPHDLRKLFRLIRELKFDPNVVLRERYHWGGPVDAILVSPVDKLLDMRDRSLIEIATAGKLRITKGELFMMATYAAPVNNSEENRIIGQWIYEVCRTNGISITVMRNELNGWTEKLEARESHKSSYRDPACDRYDDDVQEICRRESLMNLQKAAKSYLQSWKNLLAGFDENIQEPQTK